jgi:hypothetical protein
MRLGLDRAAEEPNDTEQQVGLAFGRRKHLEQCDQVGGAGDLKPGWGWIGAT